MNCLTQEKDGQTELLTSLNENLVFMGICHLSIFMNVSSEHSGMRIPLVCAR